MGVAMANWNPSCGQKICCMVREGYDLDIEQSEIDVLSKITSFTLVQRCQNGSGGIKGGQEIRDCDTSPYRLSFRLARDAHEATHSLHNQIVAGSVMMWAGLTETGNRTIDYARIARRDSRIVEPKLCEIAYFIIFNENIRLVR